MLSRRRVEPGVDVESTTRRAVRSKDRGCSDLVGLGSGGHDVLRLQQSAGNAAVASMLGKRGPAAWASRSPVQRKELPTPVASGNSGAAAGGSADSGSKRKSRLRRRPSRPALAKPRAPAGQRGAPRRISPSAAPAQKVSTGQEAAEAVTRPPLRPPDLDSVKDQAAAIRVARGEGPTREEGAAALAAAQGELEETLAASAPEVANSAETTAGSIAAHEVLAAGTAGRAELSSAARDSAAHVLAGLDASTAQLAASGAGASSVVGNTEQSDSADLGQAVQQSHAVVQDEGRAHQGAVTERSRQTDQSGRQAITEQAAETRNAAEEQARLTQDAGADIGGSAAEHLDDRAGQAKTGSGSVRSGDAAEVYVEVDTKLSGESAGQLSNASPAARDGMQAHADEAAVAIREQGQGISAVVANEAAPLSERLAATSKAAQQRLSRLGDAAGRQASQVGVAAVRQVATAARTTVAAFRQRADDASGGVADAAAGALGGLARDVRRLATASRTAEASAVRRFARLRTSLSNATEMGSRVAASLRQGNATAAEGVRTGGGGASAYLQTGASALSAELRAAGDQAGSEVGDLRAGASSYLRGIAESAQSAFTGVVDAASSAGGDLVAETMQRLRSAAAMARVGLGQATSAVRASLTDYSAVVSERGEATLAETRAHVAEGHRRIDQQTQGGPPVQRGWLSDVGDWISDQLGSLWDLVSDPAFWIGLGVTIILFPFMGPGALVVGGAAGGLYSGIRDNVRNGRPWYDPHAIIKHVAIGALAGAAFAFGGGLLVGLGLEGSAALAGTMVLSGGVGIVANLATGQRWDHGLVANLFLGWLLHRAAGPKRSGVDDVVPPKDQTLTKQEEGEEPTAKKEEPAPDEGEQARRLRALQVAKDAVRVRAEKLFDWINRLRHRQALTEKPTSGVSDRLHKDVAVADALVRRVEAATDEAEVSKIEREVRASEDQNYKRETDVVRDEVTNYVDAVTHRVNSLRSRVPAQVKAERAEDLAKLREDVETAQRRLKDIQDRRRSADSQRQLELAKAEAEKLMEWMAGLENFNDGILLAPTPATLGIRPPAAEAMRTVDAKGYDPLGDYNSAYAKGKAPNPTNHYDAARREAAGEVVATDKQGVPYDHIADLQNARNAISNARDALVREAEYPLRELTNRGKRVLQEKMERASGLLRRVDEFLGGIGWPASRPHTVRQEGGKWIGAADVPAMRRTATSRIADVVKQAKAAESDLRIMVDPAERATLTGERDQLLRDSDTLKARTEAAKTEEDYAAVKETVDRLEARWRGLRGDLALTTVPR